MRPESLIDDGDLLIHDGDLGSLLTCAATHCVYESEPDGEPITGGVCEFSCNIRNTASNVSPERDGGVPKNRGLALFVGYVFSAEEKNFSLKTLTLPHFQPL